MNNAPSQSPRFDDPPLPSSSPSSSSSPSASSSRRSSRANAAAAQPETEADADTSSTTHPLLSNEPTAESLALYRRRSKLLDLVNSYDLLVYMNLAAVYYIDNSTLLLLVRSLSHLSKAQLYPSNPTLQRLNLTPRNPRPNVFFMLLINFIAFTIHACFASASASEAARGYLHGHLITDLIGQKAASGWTGRLGLCSMDVLVATLELIALGVLSEAQKVEKELAKGNAGTSDPTTTASDAAETAHTVPNPGFVGVFGLRQRTDDVESGIELQPLGPSRSSQSANVSQPIAAGPAETDTDTATERGHLTDHENTAPQDAPEASSDLELFTSGQAIIMHLRLEDLLRDQFLEWRNRRLIGQV